MPVLQIGTEQLMELIQQLEPEERIQLLLRLAEQVKKRMKQHRAYAEQQLRAIANERGLNWDTMSEEERTEFVGELLHEP